MATETITLILDTPMERGKCYIVSGTITGIADNEDIQVRIGNSADSKLLFLIGDDGDFEQQFDYLTSDTFFKSLILVIDTGADSTYDFEITNLAVKLDPECATTYCSECFNLDNCGVAPTKEYLSLSWTNFDDGFGMNYTAVPLTHTLWIKGGMRNADYPYPTEDIFSTSGGDSSVIYADSVKTKELWVEEVAEYIHDALRIGIIHDDFRINGVPYTKEPGSYSPDWDTPNSLLAPVIVKLREKVQDTKNDNC